MGELAIFDSNRMLVVQIHRARLILHGFEAFGKHRGFFDVKRKRIPTILVPLADIRSVEPCADELGRDILNLISKNDEKKQGCRVTTPDGEFQIPHDFPSADVIQAVLYGIADQTPSGIFGQRPQRNIAIAIIVVVLILFLLSS